MTQGARRIRAAAACLAGAVALVACSHDRQAQGDDTPRGQKQQTDQQRGGGFSLPFFGGDNSRRDDQDPSTIGVNSFLWRASLDTLNFMPLASADPFGGVIITDWYSDPQRPNERFKATVYILDTRLRADALSVSIFRQEMTPTGWQDAQVTADTRLQIENAILTRARQLRLSTLRDDND
jgi:hypothetical protein